MSLTISAAALFGLLTDAKETASTDQLIPGINGVLLHTDKAGDGDVLVATSTDRFRLGQLFEHAEVTTSLRVFLRLPDVAILTNSLKPHTKNRAAHASLSVEDDCLTVRCLGNISRFPLSVEAEAFPKVASLMAEHEPSAGHFRVNPKYIAGFAKIAVRRKEALRLKQGDKHKTTVYIGSSYRGLFMGLRVNEDTTDAPVFDPFNS